MPQIAVRLPTVPPVGADHIVPYHVAQRDEFLAREPRLVRARAAAAVAAEAFDVEVVADFRRLYAVV